MDFFREQSDPQTVEVHKHIKNHTKQNQAYKSITNGFGLKTESFLRQIK